MRLIDADKLIKNYTQIFVEAYGIKCAEMFQGVINQTNTAYDIDKVVEELEKLQKETFSYAFKYNDSFYDGQLMGLDKAIEIVKRGGSNEK